MIGNVENVKILSSFHKKSKPYGKIQSRKSHGFIFRIRGDAEYFFDGKSFKVGPGEMVFLPKGSSYEYVTNQESPTLYTSINFEADIENPKVALYSLKDFSGANDIMQSFSDIWKFGSQADRYKCLSNFYTLLSYISRLENSRSDKNKNHSTISPAIDYLRKHIYDEDFKVEKLHRICGISDTYFRKIFISRFAMPPKEYVLKERLSHARLIIESGDFDSIKSVAESVGFTDALYFSKAFRKQYGFPPSKAWE